MAVSGVFIYLCVLGGRGVGYGYYTPCYFINSMYGMHVHF